MRKNDSPGSKSTSKGIEGKGRTLPDWRSEMIARLRRLIVEADPMAAEEQKWKKPSNPAGVPVWYHDGIVCHLVALKGRVRLTFLKGAFLNDQKGLFNACLDGNAMRAIDIRESDGLDEDAIKSLVRAAVTLNAGSARG
ncbi:MAG: DUF1801 domain-containing protein [Thermoplasmata archaeon]